MNAPPKFVKIQMPKGYHTCCLRLVNHHGTLLYYRDGGDWHVDFEMMGDNMVSRLVDAKQSPQLFGCPLVEVTEQEWRECNGTYAPKDV